MCFLTGVGSVTDLLPRDNLKWMPFASSDVYPRAVISSVLKICNSPP